MAMPAENKPLTFRLRCIVLLTTLLIPGFAAAESLSLKAAEQLALDNEPGLMGLAARAQASIERSVAEGELMDPKLQVGLLNLPTDTFKFNQEPVTQLKVSYIQMFPSGDSLELKRNRTQAESKLFQHQEERRKRQLLEKIRSAYIEILYWERARETVNQNRRLVGQLAEFVESMFAVGRANQDDFIAIEQRLSLLDDRVSQINQRILKERFMLSEWLSEEVSMATLSSTYEDLLWELSVSIPADKINALISTHPEILETGTQVDIGRQNLAIERENEKPGWSLNVSYAYRDEAPNGDDRADFVSAMVTFDLPLFNENRQSQRQKSQTHLIEATRLQRDVLLRNFRARILQVNSNIGILEQRKKRYQDELLPQAAQRSEATLQSYQSGSGSFADVMQAYVGILNAELELWRIRTDHLKSNIQLLYFAQSSADVAAY